MLYLDAIEQWDMLTDEQAGVLIKALLRYSKTGEKLETEDMVVKMAFSFLIAQIDRDGEKYEQKCKRNAEYYKKRKENNSARFSNIQTNSDNLSTIQTNSVQFSTIKKNSARDTDTDTDKDTDTDNITLTSNINKKEKSIKEKLQKHKYGEFKHVLLTDEEYKRLCDDFGQATADSYIKKVDEYCEMKGKSYKNYYLAIRNTFMARDRVKCKKDEFEGMVKDDEGWYVDKNGDRYI